MPNDNSDDVINDGRMLDNRPSETVITIQIKSGFSNG